MVQSPNFNSIRIDDKGRVSFSGLGSGIDYQEAVDNIIRARRIPIDTLTTRIDDNTAKITALGDLKARLNTLKETLSTLRGAVSLGNTADIFRAKQAFATTRRVDGATASQAANLLGVSVTNAAATGTRTLEVLQTAKAHKVSSDRFNSTNTALGFATGDTFTVNGKAVTVAATDTLTDLRDRINNANTGTAPSGVTASIVSVGASEHYLVLTADSTGSTITFGETTGTPLRSVGILGGTGAIKNQLQAAQTAKFYADGLLDQTNTIYESGFKTASNVQVGSAGTLTFRRDSDSAVIGTVNYVATDTLADIASRITTNVTGVTGSIVADGTGVRLEIAGGTAFSISETGAGTAIADLGIDNKRRVIERSSNTVSDLFTGVTLTLFQAEQGTTISIDIDRNLTAAKTQITNFVAAYNEVRTLINENTVRDPTTGELLGENPVLNTSGALRDVLTRLSAVIGAGTSGVSQNFSVLGQIGINFVARDGLADPLLADTLQIDEAKLDAILLNNPDDVRRLFSFDYASSDPRVSLLGFDRNTTYSATGYTLNLQPNAGSNMLSYSEEAENAYWTPTRAAVTANAIAAPDGTMTADGLVGDATNNTHFLSSPAGLALAAGQTYHFSTYVKAGARTDVRLAVAGAAVGTNAYADFNLAAGTVRGYGQGVDDATIENVGNGWYRVSIAATATAAGSVAFERYAAAPGGPTYTGDGATVDAHFWGAQAQAAPTGVVGITNLATTRATVTPDVTLGPDGAMTGDALIGDATNNTHSIANADTIAVASGTQYTLVGYAKAGARSNVRLAFEGASFASGTHADFNVATGTVVGQAGGASGARIDDMGNGWYRIEVTAAATASGNGGFRLYSADGATGTTFTGDGTTVDTYFSGLRLAPSQAVNPKGYVKATTAPVVNQPATANIGGAATGADDGSATVTDNAILVNAGGAKGLRLFYSGIGLPATIDLDFTVGVGQQLFGAIEALLDTVTGTLETEVDTLTDQNTFNTGRISEMETRLEIQRRDLTERFIRMESILATSQRILDSIRQTTEAWFGQNN